MISNSGSHRGCPSQVLMPANQTGQTQRPMLGAKIGDCSALVHRVMQCLRTQSQRTTAPDERREMSAKSCIDPFNEGRIEDSTAADLVTHGLGLCGCALHDATRHAHHAPGDILFDDLHNIDVRQLTRCGRPVEPARSGSRKSSQIMLTQLARPSTQYNIGRHNALRLTRSIRRRINRSSRSGATAPPSHSRVVTCMAKASQTIRPRRHLTRSSSHCTSPNSRGCSTRCCCTFSA